MTRINLGNGKWFDEEKATVYAELKRFNGQNQISVNTGDQWKHQKLYRTAKGSWWLNHSSAYSDSWEELSEEEAHAWLVRNEHYDVCPTATEAAEV